MQLRALTFLILTFALLGSSPALAQFDRPCPKKGHVRIKGKCVNKRALEDARRKAEEERRAKIGGVTIKTDPAGASVWLDGKQQKGTTPLVLKDLKEGVYLLKIQKGIYLHKGSLTIRGLLHPTRLYELKRPFVGLVVTSTPSGATIFFDGEKVGETPGKVLNVRAGEHVLELQKEGYAPTKQTVKLAPSDKGHSIDVSLKRQGVITIATTPKAANVLLDGKQAGTTPARLLTEPGPHTLKVSLPGYKPEVRVVKVVLGEVVDVAAKLQLTADEQARRAAEENQKKETEARRQSQLLAHKEAVTQAESSRRSRSILGYTALGAGIAVAAAGGVLVAVGQVKGNEAHDKYNSVDSFNQEDLDAYHDDLQVARAEVVAGGVLLGVGVAAVGFSIYMLATRPEIPELPGQDAAEPRVSLVPVPGGALMTIGGRF